MMCSKPKNLRGSLNTRKQSFDIEIVLVVQGNALSCLKSITKHPDPPLVAGCSKGPSPPPAFSWACLIIAHLPLAAMLLLQTE